MAVERRVSDALRTTLERGAEALGLALSAELSDRLLAFVALLQRWNRAYNLTAVREPQAMVTRHLLDSLAVLPWLEGERIIDVGTGPGLPGIPLALASPERHFVLLDSNGKKVRFVRQAVLELGLSNVEAVQSRVEAFRPECGFDTVLTRAFADGATTLALARHLCAPGGTMLLLKGVGEDDLEPLRAAGCQVERVPLTVPGTEGRRCLLRLRPH